MKEAKSVTFVGESINGGELVTTAVLLPDGGVLVSHQSMESGRTFKFSTPASFEQYIAAGQALLKKIK